MENVFGENTKKLGFGMMRLPEPAQGHGGSVHGKRIHVF